MKKPFETHEAASGEARGSPGLYGDTVNPLAASRLALRRLPHGWQKTPEKSDMAQLPSRCESIMDVLPIQPIPLLKMHGRRFYETRRSLHF